MTTIRSFAVIAVSLLVVQFTSFSTAKGGVCDLPPEVGPCKMAVPRYYYDEETATCQRFTYGGCDGNANNFRTKEECERTCQSQSQRQRQRQTGGVCDLPPEVGPCKMAEPRYYYDEETATCQRFIYGGCDGNANNFHTKEECERTCRSRSQSQSQTGGVCDLPPEVGPCKMAEPRYYYDEETATCQRFIYGGCDGNANNFHTKEECERTCRSRSQSQSQSQTGGACDSAPEPGPCKAHMKRFYYDQETGTCEEFMYGGCGGNANNYLSKEECERMCQSQTGSVCVLPPKVGSCHGHMQRYYYNKETHTCKAFIYGGCQGNENNFHTKEQCEKMCKPGSFIFSSQVCSLPPQVGPCKGHVKRYYYNKNTRDCREFIYGGCKGNANNFRTKQDCMSTCMTVNGTSPMWNYYQMSTLDDQHMFS